METTPSPQPPQHLREPWLTSSRLIALALLLAAVAALFYGEWRTRDSVADLRQAIAARRSGRNSSLVDLAPLQSAQRLAAQATLPDETVFAAAALKLADHEVDQAFASALRAAATTAPSRQQQQAQARVTALAERIKDDQQKIDALNAQLPHAKDPDDVQQDSELAQAQLALDQDDLEDAQEVLARSGPDRQAQLQQALKQQQVSEQKPIVPSPSVPALNTLRDRYEFWQVLRARRNDVQTAQSDASSSASRLLAERNQREADLQQKEVSVKDGTPAPSNASSPQAQPLDRTQTIQRLKTLAAERNTLTEYDRRISDLRSLAANYDKWQVLLLSRERLEVHYIFQGCMWILLIIVTAVLLDAAIRRYFATLPVDRSRLRNLRVFLLATVQTLAFLAVLVVVFGKPAQLYTAIGLIGAGLTVALKDFIVAFLGWFFLMGKQGLRIGDWVEIEGVAGEVVDIGLLRTVLFETGNWTDSGHPTGRRVAFFNTFAVSGHYFNFSTQGQWLWDEIHVPLAATTDAYAQFEKIERIVKEASAPTADQAERETSTITTRYGVQQFSADPTIEMRPTAAGLEVAVRYITRAQNRTSDRADLYQKIMDALREPATSRGPANP